MNLERLIAPGPVPMLSLTNADGKRWLLPVSDLRTALCLYQPGGVKGRMLKACLPPITSVAPLRHVLLRRIGGETCSVSLNPVAHQAIAEAFGTDNFSWAIFGGTPSPHSKPTLQIWTDNGLLGYCQFTDSEALYEQLFIHESRVLNDLQRGGMSHVPQVLACSKLAAGTYFFAQSTEKTPRSRALHTWTPAHTRFIASLEAASLHRMAWEETDTFASLKSLNADLGRLHPDHRESVARHLDGILAHMAGREVEAVCVHGDFTPWNSVLTPSGDLFVFDWEYATQAGLRGIDKCHFLVQSAIFERHLDIDSIVEELNMANTDATTLRVYLLDILSRFSARDPESWAANPQPIADTWVALLDRHV